MDSTGFIPPFNHTGVTLATRAHTNTHNSFCKWIIKGSQEIKKKNQKKSKKICETCVPLRPSWINKAGDHCEISPVAAPGDMHLSVKADLILSRFFFFFFFHLSRGSERNAVRRKLQ